MNSHRPNLACVSLYLNLELFEGIIKQLLNLAFVGYEEFCRSRRVLSTSDEFLNNYSQTSKRKPLKINIIIFGTENCF